MNRIWHKIANNGWYAVKQNQPTNLKKQLQKIWIQMQFPNLEAKKKKKPYCIFIIKYHKELY